MNVESLILLLLLFRENEFSTTGDVTCSFGLENINKNDSSVCVEKLCLTKQELWDNYVFGQVNYQKYNDHVQELVNDIVQKNDLKLVTSLSGLYYGNNVSIYFFVYYCIHLLYCVFILTVIVHYLKNIFFV